MAGESQCVRCVPVVCSTPEPEDYVGDCSKQYHIFRYHEGDLKMNRKRAGEVFISFLSPLLGPTVLAGLQMFILASPWAIGGPLTNVGHVGQKFGQAC